MKILYVAYTQYDLSDGIFKKILSQCKSFQHHGNEVYILYIKSEDQFELSKVDNYKIQSISNKSIKLSQVNIINKLYKHKYFLTFLEECIDLIEPDGIYMRKMPLRNIYLETINRIKSKGIKIMCEIPTFPYMQEIINNKKYVQYYVEKLNWSKFYNIVDNIPAVLHNEDEFYQKLIPINNGIDVESIHFNNEKANSEILNIVGMGYVYYYHGFDRVIKGLYKYAENNKNRNVKFNIIGDGPEIIKLRKLVKELNVSDYVEFHGKKSGKDLDDILDRCHIGIGAIGVHRKGATIDTSLKTREYCARGIPFVISAKMNDISNEFKFVKYISNNDEPVDIDELIEFYNDIDKYDYKNIMRNYAIENLTWNKSLLDVIENF